MALRIVIDGDRCVGSGNCLYWAPATFDLGDDGISVVVDPGGDDDDRIRVAEEGCPTRAITVDSVHRDGQDDRDEWDGQDGHAPASRAPHGAQEKIENQGGSHADRTD